MIKAKTVFVLGAGASKPYGFPLGRELLFDVCDCLAKPTGNARNFVMQRYLKSDQEIDRFVHELLGAQHIPSVDAFLENRPGYLDIGKPAIAVALIPHETFDTLIRQPDKTEWYEYLFQKMGTTREEFRQNAQQLSFITFNYDRSLEYFLFYSLVNAYGEEDAHNLFKDVTIVHVYGKLGNPDFLDKEGRGFAPQITDRDIEKCISEIKIMPERSEDSAEFQAAHKLISNAQVLHFLGFGYDERNMQRLKVVEIFKGFRLQGTIFGLGQSEVERVVGFFNGDGKVRWTGTSTAQISDYNILKYLKNFWHF